MKRLFYIAAAAMAVLSACTKEDPIVEVGTEPESVSMPVFKATIEGPATKTTLGAGNKVNWENGDEVVVIFKDEDFENEGTYIYEATPGVDASTATLTCKTVLQDNPAADRLFNAMYPASLITPESDVYFPETQVYAGDNKIGFAPMSSIFNVDYNNGTVKPTPETIEFKNATALLKITVPYTEMTSVQNITVSSDLAMYGNAAFEMRTNTLYIDDALNPGVNDHLILDCYAGNGNANVEIPEGDSKTFYIALPIPFFADGEKYGYLQIDVTDGTTTKSMRTTKASGIQVQRNKIYPITFAQNYIAPAAWETALTLGRNVNNGPTSIEIETGVNVSSYTVDATHKSLNAAGTLWEVLDNDVLSIQTSSNKIIAPVNSSLLFGNYLKVESITGLDKLDMSAVTNIEGMFMYCHELRSLNLSSFNTSNVTDMNRMFYYCFNLTEIIGIENFNTSNVTNMREMFCGCRRLTALNISNFVTSNVENMSGMFANCIGLTELNISNFNTSNVENMESMFVGCETLETLDLSSFNTENVTDMSYMFASCQDLQELNLSSFNTEIVTNMNFMFLDCQALQTLDLSSFATWIQPNMIQMFCNCSSLQSLYLGDSFCPGSDMMGLFDGCGYPTELTVYGANFEFFMFASDQMTTGWHEGIHFDGH